MSDDNFLSRWSRLKRENRTEEGSAPEPKLAPPAGDVPVAKGDPGLAVEKPAPLPPVESLTPESDFSPFMKPEVDESLKRQALKTLFQDPRFNVMDGLDIYIDDYSKPDPLPAGWLAKLNQAARLGDYREPDEKVAPAQQAAAIPTPAAEPESLEKVVDKESLAAPAPGDACATPKGASMPPKREDSPREA